MGATVATTASPRGATLVRSLGAETVIDYQNQKFKDVLRDDDGAFDLVGGQDLADSFDLLKREANVVTIAGGPEPTAARVDLGLGPLLTAGVWTMSAKIRHRVRRRGVGYRYLLMHPSGDDLDLLGGLVDGGRLKPVTDRVLPFQQIADAFAYIEKDRAKGKGHRPALTDSTHGPWVGVHGVESFASDGVDCFARRCVGVGVVRGAGDGDVGGGLE
jgi:NADPH:quinone reductase-like Zn-dependent oxidoreductase